MACCLKLALRKTVQPDVQCPARHMQAALQEATEWPAPKPAERLNTVKIDLPDIASAFFGGSEAHAAREQPTLAKTNPIEYSRVRSRLERECL